MRVVVDGEMDIPIKGIGVECNWEGDRSTAVEFWRKCYWLMMLWLGKGYISPQRKGYGINVIRVERLILQ